jgi:hypothetical protein
VIARAPSATRGPEASPASLYDVVDNRLAHLIDLLGLRRQAATIRDTYECLCGESLAFPAGTRPLRWSRLNADGTPFQLALALGPEATALQFLTETGPPLADNGARLVAAHEAIEELAPRLRAARSLNGTRTLLDMLAPPADVDLLSDEAGAIWLGASFTPGRSPRLKVYVNLKWGKETSRWSRLERLAASVRLAGAWEHIEPLVVGKLEPLGVSLDLQADRPIAGRIYLSGYGRTVREYEDLVGACDPTLASSLRRYCAIMLGDDLQYPTRSAVFSLGGHTDAHTDCKLELCAHCALASDVDARERSLAWLDDVGVSAEPYRSVLEILSPGPLSRVSTELHVYLGVGVKQGAVYSTFYLNPAVGPG